MAVVKTTFLELATDERLIQSTREIIKNKVFYENVNDFFTIVPGIKGGQQVAAMKGIEYVTKLSEGCGGDFIQPNFPTIDQRWNPSLAEVRLKYCYTDLLGFFTQWGLNNGYKIKDLTDVEFVQFITELVSDAIKADMIRNVLFGDTDIATNETLVDANKEDFYKVVKKGLIPTLKYFKTLPILADNFIELTANAATDPFDLDDKYALELYGKLTKRARFKGTHIISNADLYDNYVDFMEGLSGVGVESSVALLQNGVSTLKRRGHVIKPVDTFDHYRDKDFEGYLSHFALYADKNILQVGVDDERSLEELTFEYIGGSDEHFYIKANYQIDFKMVNPFEFRAAL